jgi:uncharacterized protein (TIGR00730 family)
MSVSDRRVRKILNNKIRQLYDIIADFDQVLTDTETEFFRVCIFGSARIRAESDLYKQVHELARQLSLRDVDIVTGGGPGLMEAANMGAKKGSEHSRSIGLPITLPWEADANSHIDVKRHHRRFSSRLDEFVRLSHAVVVTPGGVGTLLELFYTWQLIQATHIRQRPVILLGKEYWQGLLDWLNSMPLGRQLMSPSDLEMIKVVDSVDEAVQLLIPYIEAFRAQNHNPETP